MAEINGSRTEAALRHAFATEFLARRRFEALAARALTEGNHGAVASLLAIADRRGKHAQGHLERLESNDVNAIALSGHGTAYNIREALMTAIHDSSDLYAGMARTAREEGFEELAERFQTLAKSSRSRIMRLRHTLRTFL